MAGTLSFSRAQPQHFAFLLGYGLFTAGSLMCGVAPSLAFLIAARCFQGMGSALLITSAYAIVPRFMPKEATGWAFGMGPGRIALLRYGVPDIRLIVYKGVPVMGMLRLPTSESEGRANLHQGAIGAGIDLATGSTLTAVWHNSIVAQHPDTLAEVSGVQIPHFDRMLEIAAGCNDMTGLGYVGVDLVLDPVGGKSWREGFDLLGRDPELGPDGHELAARHQRMLQGFVRAHGDALSAIGAG